MWSFYGAYGPNKYWGFNHLEDLSKEPNTFHTEYSIDYTNEVLGKSVIPFYKMVSFETSGVNDLLLKYGEKNEIAS